MFIIARLTAFIVFCLMLPVLWLACAVSTLTCITGLAANSVVALAARWVQVEATRKEARRQQAIHDSYHNHPWR